MSKTDEIRAKAEKHSAAEAQAYADTDGKAKQGKPKQQKQPGGPTVRRTVDLPTHHHRKLDQWCSETAEELGRTRVTGQDVLRTLVAELLRDETTARKVRKALSEDQ